MKHLRKSILTLLALTLFGGAGAWAQGPTQVTQITTDLIASWQNDNSDVTLADMQALGFVAVDENTAAAWTGAPLGEFVVLIYGFDGTYFNYIAFDHGNPYTPSQTGYTKRGFYGNVAPNGGDVKHFLTSAPAAIELTKEGANQWTLGQTPDYDLELQVEYYEAHALKEIPAGWQILVNGHDSTNSIVEGSLNITETDTVTLIPDGNPRRVKSVTLADEGPAVQTVNIAGIELQIAEGDTWADIIARNSSVLEAWGDMVESDEGVLELGGAIVYKSAPYDPAQQSNYHWAM